VRQATPTSLFGHEILALSRAARLRALDDAVRHWRRNGFPYPRLSNVERDEEFTRLRTTPLSTVLVRGTVRVSTVGLRLANSFHPHIWRIPIHGRSPVDVFKDDSTLRRVLEKALRFWPTRRCWNAQCVRSVLRTLHRMRFANFRPAAARGLIETFSPRGGTVLDFSAGFGGRLLGAMAAGRNYIGIDPARLQMAGLRRMSRWLSGRCSAVVELEQGCAEDVLPRLAGHSIDLVFTSPPYFDMERYSRERTQSFVRYPTYDDWRKHFFEVALIQSARVLRRGGFLVLNVKNTPRGSVATDAADACGRLLRQQKSLRLAMTCTPSARAQGHHVTFEEILVFRKR